MKGFSLSVAAIFFALIFAVSSFAQASEKIGLIDTGMFDGDKGIAKYVTALNKVDAELKVDRDAITAQGTRFQNLKKELEGFQDIVAKGGKLPIAEADVQKKVDDLAKLERDIKFAQENYKARSERSFQTNVGPVWGDIMKAMNEFAEQKGYSVIFDGAKLEQAGVLLGFKKSVNVTVEFIAFYNARPATTAATVPVK